MLLKELLDKKEEYESIVQKNKQLGYLEIVGEKEIWESNKQVVGSLGHSKVTWENLDQYSKDTIQKLKMRKLEEENAELKKAMEKLELKIATLMGSRYNE